MKRITYSYSSFITEDRASDAVLEYAQELILTRKADVVSVPGSDGIGGRVMFDILLGPATQLCAEQVDYPPSIDVDDFMDDITARIATIRAAGIVGSSEATSLR